MERYKDPSLPIEERVADLMSRMTLEEKIMQTDQYSIIGDYTKRNADGRVEEFCWEEFEKALKGRSVGSVQFRSASSRLANQLQRYAVDQAGHSVSVQRGGAARAPGRTCNLLSPTDRSGGNL